MPDRVLFTDYFKISPARYAILFSYENMYGLFRPQSQSIKNIKNSKNYTLIGYDVHNENFESEVLTNISLAILANKIDIYVNDVICIKNNGRLYSYRYISKLTSLLNMDASFIVINDFLSEEIDEYLHEIHKNGKILEVLNGEILSVKDPVFNKTRACCIELELFDQTQSVFPITYSILGLFGKEIQNMCPGNLPFLSIKNALYYYKRNKKKNNSSLLLFNRNELEMLKSYYMLEKVAL